MRTVLLTVFLWTAWLTGFSQNPNSRWRLTTDDMLVHGPYTDFVKMTAYRLISDSLRNEYKFEAVERQRIADGLHKQLADKSVELASYKKVSDDCIKENTDLRTNLRDCGAKNEKLKSWALIGKLSVGTLTAGVGTLLTIIVLNTIHQ